MKRVMINSGLGNQMFQYAFAKGLEARGQKVVCDIGLLNDRKIHNGEQIQNLFENVDMVSTRFYPLLSRILYYCLYTYRFSILKKLLHFLSWDLVMDEQNLESSCNHQIILGYWQSPKFFSNSSFRLKFKEGMVSDKTADFQRKMCEWGGQSVSVHIRRGDYMTYNSIYGGICTVEYYKKAINYLCSAIGNPVFIVFSDDMDWVKQNIPFPEDAELHYVDFNRGKDSWQDMYLMSKCSHNIIANSTFSWWGAWLNDYPERIVICPEKFTQRGDSPDIFPKEWIKLSGS